MRVGVILGRDNRTLDTSDQEQWAVEQARADVARALGASGGRFALALSLVFTGEDGELQPSEQRAMDQFLGSLHEAIFSACTPLCRTFNLKAIVATLSMNVKDLQAIVISEQSARAERNEMAARSGGQA